MRLPVKVTETDYFEIFKDLSLRYKLPLPIIEKICFSQFECMKKVIEGADRNDKMSFKNVRMLGLGLFHANLAQIVRLKKIFNEDTTECDQRLD